MSEIRKDVIFESEPALDQTGNHLRAVPPIDHHFAPSQSFEVASFTDLSPGNTTNQEIHDAIIANRKWIYGYSTAGADVPATTGSRLKGISRILAPYPQYAPRFTSSEKENRRLTEFSRELMTERTISGVSRSIHDILQGREQLALVSIFWDLVAQRDPLIITLAQIGTDGTMDRRTHRTLTSESILAFRNSDIKGLIKLQIRDTKNSIGRTAIQLK